MSDPYADWDGAYVMGALSRAERQEYEDHLATCDDCAAALAELGPLPGLLGRVAPEDAELLLRPAADPPPSIATPRVVPLAWWRRTRVRVGAGLAAAAVVAAAVIVPISLHGGGPTERLTLVRTVASPLSATVSLTATDWGTRVDMTCEYAGYHGRQRPYRLYVIDPADHAQLVSSWHAGPGDTDRTTGSTDLSVSDISRIEVRAADGTVLLSARA
jgi:anti-sigma-K factor RskA